MFRGRYEHNVDEKGRTSFPAKFREVLAGDERLVVTTKTKLGDTCLIAYPFPAWADFEKRLDEKPTFDRGAVLLRRHFVGAAEECLVDKQGRVLLPARLRKDAGIEDSLVWIGQGRTLEIWASHKWQEQEKAAESPESIEDLRKKLEDMGL